MRTSEVIRASIAEWQKRLLQLDRRNNLLYFKQTARSAVRILADIDEFLGALSDSRAGLTFDYAERRSRRTADPFALDPDHPVAQADEPYVVSGEIRTDHAPLELQPRLKNLRRRDREWREEQGVNVLFLAVGFVSWIDEDGVEGRAPLLLVPCDLDVASPRDPYTLLRESDEIDVNATLAHKLSMLGVELPEYENDRAPSGYLAQVQRLIAHKPEWAVTPEIVLSTFQYSKMAMWKDLDTLRSEGVEQDLVGALAGDPDVTPPEPPPPSAVFNQAVETFAGGRLDDALNTRDQLLVLPADDSQLLSVAAAGSGQHLVIHGPPGTGKSQTIANIIGSFIASGKSVLFVSEKTAALDVVKRRLEDCNLGVFCLDLHSERGKKGNVYEQLRGSLEDDRVIPRKELDYGALDEARRTLNGYVRALHERRMPLGETAYQVTGKLAALRDIPDVPFAVDEARGIDDARIRETRRLADRIGQRAPEFAQHHTSLWIPLRDAGNPVGLSDQLRRGSRGAMAGIRDAQEAARRVENRLGAPAIADCAELVRYERVLDVLATAPGVPMHWIDRDVLGRLKESAPRQEEYQRNWRSVRQDYDLALVGRPTVRFADVAQRFDAALEDEETLVDLFGSDWSSRCTLQTNELLAAAGVLPGQNDAVLVSANQLAQLLGAKVPLRRSDLRRLSGQAAVIGDLDRVPEAWVAPLRVTELDREWSVMVGDGGVRAEGASARAAIATIQSRVDEVAALLARLTSAETTIARDFDEHLVESADHDMLVRYRTDHRNFFRRLGGQYRKDQRVLNGARKSAGKLTLDEATNAVELALEVKTLREGWQARASVLPDWLGARFKARETDWEQTRGDLIKVSNLYATLSLNGALADCLAREDSRATLDEARSVVDNALALLEATETSVLGAGRTPSGTDALDSTREQAVAALPALSALKTVLDDLQPYLRSPLEDIQGLAAILATAVRLEELEDAEAERLQVLRRDFGERYHGLDTDWAETQHAIEWLESFLRVAPEPMSAALLAQVEHPLSPESYREWRADIAGAAQKFDDAAAGIDAAFDVDKTAWDSWRTAEWLSLITWLETIAREADGAADFLQYRRLVGELENRIGVGVVSTIRGATDDARLVALIVERRIYSAWLEALYDEEPTLRDFADRDHRDAIEEFKALDAAAPVAAQKEIRQRLFSRYPGRFAIQAGGGQLATLDAQLSRKRGQLPVRKLMERIPTLVQSLKPCFMMSPLAVSQFLPKGDPNSTLRFDVVIFDEASQVFPEDAVPAIERASQVIVVGDEKQLPPTSFFRRDLDGADEYGSTEDDLDDTDALSGRESILDVMCGMRAKGVAESYLRVHYRSRHEDLIRFSNHHFYGERLLVFPSPRRSGRSLGLLPVYLADGVYDAGEGRTRTNQREAEEVVRLVFEHMRSMPSDESLGVVTLSRAQADLIEHLIAEKRVLERDVDDRFSDEADEPFFVKNLENVQGDERDWILFSTTFGREARGGVSNNFGPLNRLGGERRLNVAISRSRESMTTVYSLRPTAITSAQPGAQLLRRWLEFNESPDTYLVAQQSIDPSAEPESPFEESVMAALRARGHIVQPQVGVAGFRIDLAIMSPDGQACDLGIECDGWTYHQSPAARDRDWLRQSILEGLGWRIHRIWSTSWIRNPDEQVTRIEEALELARAPRAVEALESQRGLPSPPLPDSQATPARLSQPDSERWIFEPYVEAGLRDIRFSTELQYAPRAELEPIIIRVAEVEGPVHLSVAIDRIRAHYGMSRARQVSRDHVRSVIEELGRKNQLTVWREGSVTKKARPSASEMFFKVVGASVTARRPADGTSSRRLVTQISFDELECGVLLVARALFGASRDALLRETARQCWYDRIGPDINARIGTAIDSLVKDRRLVESFGMLTSAAE